MQPLSRAEQAEATGTKPQAQILLDILPGCDDAPGLGAQHRRVAATVEMGLIVAALVYGYLFVDSYDSVIAMGVLLGIAGASFGVALSLGSGWFPSRYKGLAMGLAGAGNSGTVLAVLFAPPLA